MPVYRNGNSFSDSPFGPNGERLTTAIRALTVGNRRRVTGRRLDPSGEPAAVGPERTTVARDPESTGTATGTGGLVSPVTEQPYTGEVYYELLDSSGLFTFEYSDETEYEDAEGTRETRVHLAP